MCVVQSVDRGFTDNGVFVNIVKVLFLPFPCVCVQEFAEVTVADLPDSQGALSSLAHLTVSVPPAGVLLFI